MTHTGTPDPLAGSPDPQNADEALWLSEARYRAIVEDQPDLVCRFLADGTLTFANEAYCRFFGLRREDAVGRPYQPIVHPDDVAAVQAQVASLSPDRPVVFIENRVIRVDGAVRWTEWTNRALYDESGRLVEFQSAGRDVTDRRRADEHTARLAAIVASADIAIYSTSLEGVITSWNRAAERMFGYTAKEAIGRPLSIILPENEVETDLEMAARLMQGQAVEYVETERLTNAGQRLPVALTLSPIRDVNGGMIGISRIARDITERKHTERELQERESRFRVMADHAPVLIWMADTSNKGVYFNRPWIEFTGVPLEGQLGDGWIDLIHADDRPTAGAYCQEHFDRRLPFTMEFRLRHRTGEYRWVQDTGQPLLLPDGTFNGYIGTCIDIHARKAAEHRMRRILEGVSDAFSAVDREWRFTYVNDRFAQRAGRSRDELLGRVCWDILPEAQRTRLYPLAQQAVRDQQPVRVEEHYEPLDLWIETRLYPTPDGLIAFMTDISERKRLDTAREETVRRESEARAAAEQANRLKDEFLAVVSHELRTPLNAILGWAHMLRRGIVAADAASNALDTIERNAQIQVQLVDDLLDVSRIVNGKFPLRVEPVNLASVIQAAAEAVHLAAANKQIDVRLDVPEGALTMSGDASRLQQAFWNLLTNSIKFTPAGGRVDVQLRRAGSEAVVTIRDTGIGIPADALPFIFERFRQADSRTTRAHGGLGLGLAIVEYVVQAHGGVVRADSAGPGRGAVFEVSLPIRTLTPSAGPPAPAATGLPVLGGCRVLVVDDDADARDLIRYILEASGAVVTTAASVTEALVALGAARPDVLVGDIGMPAQDGYDLIRLIRATYAGGRIPALALTAYADEKHRDAALNAGYDAHLRKPVDPQVLCVAIAELRRHARTGIPEASGDGGPSETAS